VAAKAENGVSSETRPKDSMVIATIMESKKTGTWTVGSYQKMH